MPLPNNHSCRLVNPDKVKVTGTLTFRHNGKIYRAIKGKMKATGKSVTQAFRYPKKIWTVAQARDHCKEKGGRFEAAKRTEQQSALDYTKSEDNPLIPDYGFTARDLEPFEKPD